MLTRDGKRREKTEGNEEVEKLQGEEMGVTELTVDGAPDGVGLGEVVDAVEQLRAVALAVLLHGVDLRHGGRGVGPEDGLAVLPAGGVAAGVAAARRAHCRGQ